MARWSSLKALFDDGFAKWAVGAPDFQAETGEAADAVFVANAGAVAAQLIPLPDAAFQKHTFTREAKGFEGITKNPGAIIAGVLAAIANDQAEIEPADGAVIEDREELGLARS
jgi:hypothetical protein